METAYHFDVLPVHLPTEPLESLESFLIRLDQWSSITWANGISAHYFPYQERRIARDFASYSPTTFEIVEVTGENKASLSGMTFFHLGIKIRSSPKPQLLSRFPTQSISLSLRYCPRCLAIQRDPYRLLPCSFFDV